MGAVVFMLSMIISVLARKFSRNIVVFIYVTCKISVKGSQTDIRNELVWNVISSFWNDYC